jgi:transcriptional regulator with XRE-family HTH domain
MQTNETLAINRAAGAALRLQRKILGLTQNAVAEKIGVTFQQVQKYENGHNRLALSTLLEMERTAGIDAEAVLRHAKKVLAMPELAEAQYPASFTVHWATGPVDCCDRHRRSILRIGTTLGLHAPVSVAAQGAECSNCRNEAGHGAAA